MQLARGGFTEQEIRDALHAKDGRRYESFRYELLVDGARVREIKATGSVSLDAQNEIGRTARLKIYNDAIDWLQCRIKIHMRLAVRRGATIGFAEFPLGVFIPSTPTKENDGAIVQTRYAAQAIKLNPCKEFNARRLTFEKIRKEHITWGDINRGFYNKTVRESVTRQPQFYYDVECYDPTIILREDCFTDRYFIAAGTRYLDAVNAILISAGVPAALVVDMVATAVPADREFEMGETKLSAINTLLQEINFNPIYCDADGNFVLKRYADANGTSLYRYDQDSISVLYEQASVTQDFYSVPNTFIAVASNPDTETDYRAVYVNDDPASPFSTIQRGRSIVSEIYRLDAVASQDELNAFVKRKAFEASEASEQIKFSTALMPFHGMRDLLEIRHAVASGLYLESGWEMDLSSGGEMRHTARRVGTIG